MNLKYFPLIFLIISLKIGQIELTKNFKHLLQVSRNLTAFNGKMILPAANQPLMMGNKKMEQRSPLSTLSTYSKSKQSFGHKFANKNLAFSRTKTSPFLPSMYTQSAKFSTANSKLDGYTEKDVERYYLRNNLKTKMEALKKMNDENEYKKFRDVFGTKNEIKIWNLEDKFGQPSNGLEALLLPPQLIQKWTNEKVAEYFDKNQLDEERLKRWRMESKIDESKLQQIRENRKEIFKKANKFAIEQLDKLDELYWSEESKVDLNDFPMPAVINLHNILWQFMPWNFALDENTALFDDEFYEQCFPKNDDAERKINLTYCLEYLRTIKEFVELKISFCHEKLQSILIHHEKSFIENTKILLNGRKAIQATMIDLESFKLHFEMAELALNAALLAQDAEIHESKLEELAKMKFYAKKLQIVQLIMKNFAHGGLLAFGYKENEKEENKNLTAKLGDEKSQMKALREIQAQMEIMGYKNKLDRNWALKMEKGNIEEIEKFIGREILTKSEAKMLGYIAQIYLLIDPKLTEEEFE